jgi:hypothetical protein
MNTVRLAQCVAASLCLALVTHAQPPEDAPPAQESAPAAADVFSASALLSIRFDPGSKPLSDTALQMILQSSDVRDAAIQKVLGKASERPRAGEAPEVHLQLMVSQPYGSGGAVLANVYLAIAKSEGHQPRARELLREVIRRFSDAIARAWAADTEGAVAHLEQAEAQADAARKTLHGLLDRQRDFLEKAGQSDLSRDALLKSLSRVRDTQRILSLDLAGERARSESLEQQIAATADDVQKKVENDEAAAYLRRVAEIREQAVARVSELIRQGAVSESELLSAQDQHAQARADLARQRLEAARHAGQDQLARMSEQLTLAHARITELQKKLEIVEQELNRTREKGLLELCDELELEVNARLPIARRNYEGMLQRLSDLRTSMPSPVGPKVIILNEDK